MEIRSLTKLIGRVRVMAPERRILLFGSSSLFASFPTEPPARLGLEVTIDADFLIDPDCEALRDELDAVLGRDNEFHNTTGFYGDFVDLRVSGNFPPGWRERLVPMLGFENVFALDPVDMAAAKIAATASVRLSRRMARGGVDRGMKDIGVVSALLRARLIAREAIEQRLATMNHAPAMIVESAQVLEETLARARDGEAGESGPAPV